MEPDRCWDLLRQRRGLRDAGATIQGGASFGGTDYRWHFTRD